MRVKETLGHERLKTWKVRYEGKKTLGHERLKTWKVRY